MKHIIKFCVFLSFSAVFQSGLAMKLNPFMIETKDIPQAIELTRPEKRGAEKQLWDLVFKACKDHSTEAVQKIAINCLTTLVKQNSVDINASYEIEFAREQAKIFFGTDNAFYTPLVFAISSKKPLLINALLDLGAGLDFASTMGTPLHAAVTSGNHEVIPELIQRGANLNESDQWGQTPLFTVLYQQNIKAFNALYAYQHLDCNHQDNMGQTPPHFVVLRDNPSIEVVKKLMARGANPHIKDRLGHSALDYARDGGYRTIAKLFNGESLDNKDGFLADTIVAPSQQQKLARKMAALKKSKQNKKSRKKVALKQPKADVVSPTKRTDHVVEIETTSPTKKSKSDSPRHNVEVEAEVITPTKVLRDGFENFNLDKPARRTLSFGDKDDVVPVARITADRVDKRVQQWFDGSFLQNERNKYRFTTEFAKSVYYHQIPLNVINCIITHGRTEERASQTRPEDKGTHWFLRGEMVFDNPLDNPWFPGRAQQSGYYHCTMNSAGTIYHVGFDPVRDGSSQLSAYILPMLLQTRTVEFPGASQGIKHQFEL